MIVLLYCFGGLKKMVFFLFSWEKLSYSRHSVKKIGENFLKEFFPPTVFFRKLLTKRLFDIIYAMWKN